MQGRADFPRKDLRLDYLAATVAVAVSLLVRLAANPLMEGRAPWVFYFPALAITAWRYGSGPSVWALALCAASGYYLWVPPAYAFVVKNPQDLYILFAFVLSGSVIVAFGASNQRTHRRLNDEAEGRERTSRELAESTESFRGVFNHAQGDAVILMDAEARIVAWNPGAERIFGHAAKEAIGQPGAMIFTPEDRAAGVPEEEFARATRNATTPNVRWQLRRDGTRFWANGSLIALHNAEGAIRGYLKVVRDETERHDLEQATRDHAEALERHVAEQTADLRAANAELEGFTYSVSHDMRSPLRAIVANAQLLSEEYADDFPPEAIQRLDRIAANGRRMGLLIEDLLTYARLNKQALHKAPLDLVPLFREVVTQEAEGIAVDAYAPAELRVMAEPGLMRMVLENLVGNAIKYRRTDVPLRLKFHLVQRAGQCGYALRDNGIGFDPQFAPKLFQAFERLHRIDEYAGTGIGLANVKRIVERHGGTVWAEGEPGVGATFGFTLP